MSAATPSAAPPRKQFRLTGPSVALEPGRYAVRRDVAEIGAADRIFAQHYVEPVAYALTSQTSVHARPSSDSEVVASLPVGSVFHLVDLGHDWAWGRGDKLGSVGYIPASKLNLP